MGADARLVAFAADAGSARSVDLFPPWVKRLPEAHRLRKADVGAMVLTHVCVLSKAEAQAINEAILRDAHASLEEKQRAGEENPLLVGFETNIVNCCLEVREALESVGSTSYFSPWVVVETANID